MTHSLDDTLSAIDAATTDSNDSNDSANAAAVGTGHCRRCGTSLAGLAGYSVDFCGEDCQETWHAAQATTIPLDGGREPNDAMPEQDPPRPLSWLYGPYNDDGAPKDGAAVLDALVTFIGRFSVFPSEHCAPTLALWYAHTHGAEHFYVTPRLILDSAEPGSGKTRVLEVAQYLVAAPEMTISATTAALFRMVAAGPITILFDEVDAIFNSKASGNNEDLRGLLNAGYKRSATVARCVGDAKAMQVERFPVYAPAALAGIAGHMPTTITTRAITIHMRRRALTETVEPFRERTVAREAAPLRKQLAAWIEQHADQLAESVPAMPEGVTDRPAEIWEPLLAVADTAGGHWPETARAACTHFVTEAAATGHGSVGVRLLGDLRWLFTKHQTDRLHTGVILAELCEMDEAPWGDYEGKPLDSRRLAALLARYEVRSADVKVAGTNRKGYRTDWGLTDAWTRYLESGATSATGATPQVSPVALTDAVAHTSATGPLEPPPPPPDPPPE